MTDAALSVAWWEAEPTRLKRDRREINEKFPQLELTLEGQGSWSGRLPLWPFERPEPPGLADLLDDKGLALGLCYVPAYPAVTPWLVPVEPQPLIEELTQTRWHVLGNGALCLVQTQADWDPGSSIIDLLLKAAGWHVEYALLKADVRTDMTLAGIVHDDSLDPLIAEAAARRSRASTDDPPADSS